MNVLFLCSQNMLRSPTAEQVFATWPGIETRSAGLAPNADHRLGTDDLEWADLIFVMEELHRRLLAHQFRPHLKAKRVVCLDIPDDYGLMDPELVEILERKVGPHLRQVGSI